MRPRNIPITELALAYELRSNGYRMNVIAQVFSRDPDKLSDAIKYLKRKGFPDAHQSPVVPDNRVPAAAAVHGSR